MADVPPVDFKMMSEIDIGIQNYTLKCITGPMQDKFKYLPTNKSGLVIGTGKTNDQLANDSRKYWNFEDQNLAVDHCFIVYSVDYMVYLIQDLSYKELLVEKQTEGSPKTNIRLTSKGTWLSVPNLITSHDWFNLHSELNYKRDFKIVVGDNELPFRFCDQ